MWASAPGLTTTWKGGDPELDMRSCCITQAGSPQVLGGWGPSRLQRTHPILALNKCRLSSHNHVFPFFRLIQMHPLPTLGDFLLPNLEAILGHLQVEVYLNSSLQGFRAPQGYTHHPPGASDDLGTAGSETEERQALPASRSSGPGQVAGCACRRTALREMPQCAKEIHGVSRLCFCTEGLREGFIKKTILEQGFEGEKVLDLLRG